MWQRLCSMLENEFGINCEIILHDLTKEYDHTVVDIRNGHITGRKIGDCGSNLGLEVLRGTVDNGDRYNYVVHTAKNGKILRSSTMFIKDDEGKVIGSLCINVDITSTLHFEGFLRQYNGYEPGTEDQNYNFPEGRVRPEQIGSSETNPIERKVKPQNEVFATDISQVLEYLISEADNIAGKPVEELNREEKIEFVRYLDTKGAFLVTKSSDKVCEHLNISRFTLYNYLDFIRNDSTKNTEKEISK
ncbi:MAG: helix-turn-helix transcriptional regulator [Ruminiclostridium sp.]